MAYVSYQVATDLPPLGPRSVGVLGALAPVSVSRERVLASFEAAASKVLTPDQLATFRPCMANQPAGVLDSDMGNACIKAAKALPAGSGAPGTVMPGSDPNANVPTSTASMVPGVSNVWLIAGGAVLALGLGYVLLK